MVRTRSSSKQHIIGRRYDFITRKYVRNDILNAWNRGETVVHRRRPWTNERRMKFQETWSQRGNKNVAHQQNLVTEQKIEENHQQNAIDDQPSEIDRTSLAVAAEIVQNPHTIAEDEINTGMEIHEDTSFDNLENTDQQNV
jgi:hypothetical protein